MQATIVIVFLALCISAPWIARKWGMRGGLAWFIFSLGFLVSILLFLGDV